MFSGNIVRFLVLVTWKSARRVDYALYESIRSHTDGEVNFVLLHLWRQRAAIFGLIAAFCGSMSTNVTSESQSSENNCSASTSVLAEVNTTPEGKDLKERTFKR